MVFHVATGTPLAWAAISLSRIASRARPTRMPVTFSAATTSSAVTTTTR